MTFGMAVVYSLVGVCVVFFALILLMCIIKLITVADGKEAEHEPAPVAAPAAPAVPAPTPVPGRRYTREVKLYDTDPRAAVMLMAIIAEATKIPISQLHFISIKEVKEPD